MTMEEERNHPDPKDTGSVRIIIRAAGQMVLVGA